MLLDHCKISEVRTFETHWWIGLIIGWLIWWSIDWLSKQSINTRSVMPGWPVVFTYDYCCHRRCCWHYRCRHCHCRQPQPFNGGVTWAQGGAETPTGNWGCIINNPLLVDWLIDWLENWLLVWLIGCNTDWLVVTHWWIVRLIDWLIDFLILWMIVSAVNRNNLFFIGWNVSSRWYTA